MSFCFEAGIRDWGLGIRRSEVALLTLPIPNPQSRIAGGAR